MEKQLWQIYKKAPKTNRNWHTLGVVSIFIEKATTAFMQGFRHLIAFHLDLGKKCAGLTIGEIAYFGCFYSEYLSIDERDIFCSMIIEYLEKNYKPIPL